MALPPRPSELPPGRWTDTALRVLRERYLLKDARGTVIESPEDLCWRVAWTVAQAERQYGADEDAVFDTARAFYQLMASGQWLPNSPTLMNAGKDRHLSLAACFPPGTIVSTLEGPQPIETLKPGMTVLTHRGRFRPIGQVFQRQFAGTLVRLRARKLGWLSLTPEHPVLTVRGNCWATHTIQPEWVCADALTVRDYVCVPIPDAPESAETLTPDGLTEDLCWLYGFYLANGSLIDRGARFTVNRADRPYADRVLATLRNTFGYAARIEEAAPPSRPGHAWLDIRAHSKAIGQHLEALFGHGFAGKHLPPWALGLPRALTEALLVGVWQGDGTLVSRGYYRQARLALSNERLIRQLFLLHLTLGHQPGIRSVTPGRAATAVPWVVEVSGIHVQPFLERVFSGRRGSTPVRPQRDGVEQLYSFQIPGYALYRIETLQRELHTGDVWNLKVEDDHSYTAHFVAVHNCYVYPIGDSMPDIFNTLRDAAITHQAGGGTGFAFSRLRPAGSRVRSSGGAASGPLSFLRVFDHASKAVTQGGTRRGANMSILRCDHPDILEFIDSKRDGSLTNFNISVGVTDEFMAALAADAEYPLRAQAGWPRPDGSDYEAGELYLNPATGQPMRLRAPEVWDKICRAAWATGDPGLFFIDRTNRSPANPVPDRYSVESTNPCVTGDTLVATAEGWCPAEKIEPGTPILTPTGPKPIARVTQSVHPVFRVRFSDGGEVRATAGHQFFARPAAQPGHDYRPIRLDQLGPGDLVRVTRADHPRLASWTGEAKILSITPEGAAQVWDLFEPATDTWLPEGYLSRGCGEQPLFPNDQCTLGSLNLAAFVREETQDFDWERLGTAATLATRFLDDVLDVSATPTAEVSRMVRLIRRIGLGVMGWADALILLGLPYDSDEAVSLGARVMQFITERAERASIELQTARGPFPLWRESIYRDRPPRRNSTVTTVAPTGTISILCGCSSGIEPLYAVAYTHTVRRPEGDRVLRFMHPLFERIARARGFYTEALQTAIERHGTVRGRPEVPEDVQRLFGTAHEIAPEWHVRHQAAFQAHTQNGVSKTINLSHSATVEDVDRAYRLAWDLGCLGITVFRDGSKGEQVLTLGARPAAPVPPAAPAPGPAISPRPHRLPGEVFKQDSPLGNIFVIPTRDERGDLFEVFILLGKAGSDLMAFTEALGRTISTLLRYDRLPSRQERAQDIAHQLQGIGGASSIGFGPEKVLSVPDAISKVLQELLTPEPQPGPRPPNPDCQDPVRPLGDLCPTCGAAGVVQEEGCRHCLACGLYSEC